MKPVLNTASVSPTNRAGVKQGDSVLQERLLGMLRKKGQPIYLSEFTQRTKLTSEKIEATLAPLLQAGTVTKTGKKYELATEGVESQQLEPVIEADLEFGDYSKDEMHVLAALYYANDKRETSEICNAVSRNALGGEPIAEGLQVVREFLNEVSNPEVGLVNVKKIGSVQLFSLTSDGKSLVESWHKSSAGKEFKDLKYWVS